MIVGHKKYNNRTKAAVASLLRCCQMNFAFAEWTSIIDIPHSRFGLLYLRFSRSTCEHLSTGLGRWLQMILMTPKIPCWQRRQNPYIIFPPKPTIFPAKKQQRFPAKNLTCDGHCVSLFDLGGENC